MQKHYLNWTIKCIRTASTNDQSVCRNRTCTESRRVYVLDLYRIRTCIYLFVCLGIYIPLDNFIWRRHHYRWRAANFYLCSALMAIEKWMFFSVLHLLWHGASFLIVISEDPWHSHLLRLTMELPLPVFTTYIITMIRIKNIDYVYKDTVRKTMILPHLGSISTNCYHSVVRFQFKTSSEK